MLISTPGLYLESEALSVPSFRRVYARIRSFPGQERANLLLRCVQGRTGASCPIIFQLAFVGFSQTYLPFCLSRRRFPFAVAGMRERNVRADPAWESSAVKMREGAVGDSSLFPYLLKIGVFWLDGLGPTDSRTHGGAAGSAGRGQGDALDGIR